MLPMSHDVIYFPSEKYFSDRIYVCPMDPSEPSESRFVHRSQIDSIGHIWIPDTKHTKVSEGKLHVYANNIEFEGRKHVLG